MCCRSIARRWGGSAASHLLRNGDVLLSVDRQTVSRANWTPPPHRHTPTLALNDTTLDCLDGLCGAASLRL